MTGQNKQAATAEPRLDHFNRVRSRTEELAARLSDEDCMLQSMTDASPTKWHLAHVTWFFETFVLKPNAAAYQVFDPAYEVLFNSYYNAVGPQFARDRRGMLSRPSRATVMDYRAHVDAAMQKLLGNCADDVWTLIELGLNHEQQHQELIVTDILHGLSENPLHPAPFPIKESAPGAPLDDPAFVAFDGGMVEIGTNGPDFHFDNEGPRHQSYLAPFAIADRPVTNADWFNFINDGGYDTPSLWLSDGWAMVQQQGWRAPLYWQREADNAPWQHYTLGGLKLVNQRAPASHISFYEADAFAQWAGKRLPLEAEWEVAANAIGTPDKGAFQQLDQLTPPPLQAGQNAMFGSVWEWTASSYCPYRGFKAAAGAVGEYNGKFMSGQMVLRGGSVATPADHIRATYRNFFYPHMRWQFSGLRLAEDR